MQYLQRQKPLLPIYMQAVLKRPQAVHELHSMWSTGHATAQAPLSHGKHCIPRPMWQRAVDVHSCGWLCLAPFKCANHAFLASITGTDSLDLTPKLELHQTWEIPLNIPLRKLGVLDAPGRGSAHVCCWIRRHVCNNPAR